MMDRPPSIPRFRTIARAGQNPMQLSPCTTPTQPTYGIHSQKTQRLNPGTRSPNKKMVRQPTTRSIDQKTNHLRAPSTREHTSPGRETPVIRRVRAPSTRERTTPRRSTARARALQRLANARRHEVAIRPRPTTPRRHGTSIDPPAHATRKSPFGHVVRTRAVRAAASAAAAAPVATIVARVAASWGGTGYFKQEEVKGKEEAT